MIRFTFPENTAPERVDVFVVSQLPEISRATIQKWLEQAQVKINDKPARASYKLRGGDRVIIEIDLKKLTEIPPIDIPVLYEDDDCIVLNKPEGLLTHSKGSFNPEATVATFIKPLLKDHGDERAGIVHRLDRVTSGVIIAAKTLESQKWLQKQFAQRKAKKTYVAVVEGVPDPKEAIIDVAIERHPRYPKLFRPGSYGKAALTQYKVLKTNSVRSLVELKPTTGRTHQLRVHLKHLKTPILGDILYGGEPAPRVFLHAQALEITLPNKQRRTFTSPLPKTFLEQVT